MNMLWSELPATERLNIARSDPARARKMQAEAAIAEQERMAWGCLTKLHGQAAIEAARQAIENAKAESAGGES